MMRSLSLMIAISLLSSSLFSMDENHQKVLLIGCAAGGFCLSTYVGVKIIDYALSSRKLSQKQQEQATLTLSTTASDYESRIKALENDLLKRRQRKEAKKKQKAEGREDIKSTLSSLIKLCSDHKPSSSAAVALDDLEKISDGFDRSVALLQAMDILKQTSEQQEQKIKELSERLEQLSSQHSSAAGNLKTSTEDSDEAMYGYASADCEGSESGSAAGQ